MTTDAHLDMLRRLKSNRLLAHTFLFKHRHPNKTPMLHADMLRLWHAPEPRVVAQAFRGAAKSTLLTEEDGILGALFDDFRYNVIIGPTYKRAVDRLKVIKHELATNELIFELFGPQIGPTWNDGEIITARGVKFEALGRGQSLRGAKELEQRPDRFTIDDIEDDEEAQSEAAYIETWRWMHKSVEPALDPITGKMRWVGTPVSSMAAIEEARKSSEWKSGVYPIMYKDPATGEDVATWPDRFPLDWCYRKREQLHSIGEMQTWNQEYMCVSQTAEEKTFHERHIKVDATPRSIFFPRTIIVDPARTVNADSARTGYVAYSWERTNLVVHQAYGAFDKPDAIVDSIFELDRTHQPWNIFVEKDGLEEFLMQPLRQEMLKRSVTLPITGINARRDIDKIRFIKGLQPFAEAGEIIMTANFADLRAEMINFPAGRKDVLNALAYAPQLRNGKPVYEEFAERHVVTSIEAVAHPGAYLAVNATSVLTTAVLIQIVDNVFRIIADWVIEHPPLDALQQILAEAALINNGRPPRTIVPAEQMQTYATSGLVGALRRYNDVPTLGVGRPVAQNSLSPWLTRSARGVPALLVARGCRWTVNGLVVGYARPWKKDGQLAEEPYENSYKTLVQGVEALAGWFVMAAPTIRDGEDEDIRYATGRDGRPYKSALARPS